MREGIDISQSIAILANAGVIAGIIFLGFELRQNQQLSLAQTQSEIANARIQLTQNDLSGPIPDILARYKIGETLSAEDQIRMNMWMDGWLRYYANVYYQNLQGLYDVEDYEANLREIESWLSDGSYVTSHYCRTREIYSAKFVAAIDEMLAHPCE